MHKRSPALGIPNDARRHFDPSSIKNFLNNMLSFVGITDDAFGDGISEIDQQDISIIFDLAPAETLTRSLDSLSNEWVMVERRASIASETPDLMMLSSFVQPNDGGDPITLTEDTPVRSVFGTGQWQRSFIPVTYENLNGRVFAVTNLSAYQATVTLTFKVVRLIKNRIEISVVPASDAVPA